MGTTTDKLQYTIDAIDAIGVAIEDKTGESVGSIPLNQWANKIDTIDTSEGSPTVAASRYFLRMRVLTKDNCYQIIETPIQAGDIIDLGEGQDVEASTGWADGSLGSGAHPAMEFQEWSSSAQIIDNKLYVPETLYDNIHGGALYITSDRKNYLVKVVANTITYEVIDEWGEVFKDSTSEDINTIISFWGGNASDICITYAKYMQYASVPTDYDVDTALSFYYCDALQGINLSNDMPLDYILRNILSSETFTFVPYGKTATITTPSVPNLRIGQIPDTVTNLSNYIYSTPQASTERLFFPSSIINIPANTFSSTAHLSVLLLASTLPPTLGGYTQFSERVFFLVPETSLSEYKAATNWSALSERILPATEDNLIKFGYK